MIWCHWSFCLLPACCARHVTHAVTHAITIRSRTPSQSANALHLQDPVTGDTMAGITMIPNYLGVSNTVVRDLMWTAARLGICTGNYNTAIWASVAAAIPNATPVLYNSAFCCVGVWL